MATTSARPDGRGLSVSMVTEWRIARNLFPIYVELARRSGQCAPPFSTFGTDDRPESLDAVRKWFDAVDASCSAVQFRTDIEAVVGVNDTAWHTVALHFLAARRSDSETRKKLAFVLTRYCVISSPPSFHTKSITRRQIADVLQPLIGDCPDWTEPTPMPGDEFVGRLESCRRLADLMASSHDLEKWEEMLGDRYLLPIVLAQSTHLHFVLHLVAIQTIQPLLAEIVTHLKALRESGVETLDCRAAGLSEQEPIDKLVETWADWNPPSDIEYRLEELVRVLAGVDKALAAMQSNTPDPRVEAELATLRGVAERLTSQLSAVTERLQRLESLVERQGAWSPSADTMAAVSKFRVTPPPVIPQSATITPIAARPAMRTMNDPKPSAPHPSPPGNGSARS